MKNETIQRPDRRAVLARCAMAGAATLAGSAAWLAPTSRAHAQAAARPRVSLTVGYIDTSINGVGVIAAANKLDLWAKSGIDVKLIPFTNGPTQIQAMAAGSLDIGYVGGGAIWMPASGQAVLITPNEKTFGDFLLARPDSGIRSVQDMRGKKVGVPDGGSGEMILTLALEAAGMTMKDIQRIPLDPPNVVSAFVAGQIDVAAIFSPLANQIRERLPNTVVIANNKDFPKTEFIGAWVASKQALASKPEAVQRFLEVWQQVNDYRLKNPKEVVAWASAASGAPAAQLQGQVDALEWFPSSQILADNKSGATRQRFVTMQELFVKLGRIKTPAAPDAFINTDLFNKAMESRK
ncbi:aliphatic sulfonate ABC transporter substrate-binding protein [Variovorax sp. J22P168]|uniref:aliphatic sulfonate ABC transporter substrate-binding protein n=1 Tax=Variovorax jilinensis TaxID=3053513 RepID=UPI0025783F19|nr:aliphatic sulfonate ABC transporter substrate-binding protein [Variovorax sp. J22P168]MDM0013459.1 aliphatic sulfonate ABC transporter substrate-binding protein [Variovorax sp. J22P168]